MSSHIYVIAGGTLNHVRPHFAVVAPAYGAVGVKLSQSLLEHSESQVVIPIFTRMARGSYLDLRGASENFEKVALAVCREAGLGDKLPETNADLSQLVDYLMSREDTRCLVMATAICDWEPDSMLMEENLGQSSTVMGWFSVEDNGDDIGKEFSRLKTRGFDYLELFLTPADKIINGVRRGDTGRKDIFLVSFKATTGMSDDDMYLRGLRQLKDTSSNLVLVNDLRRRRNLIVTPEQARYVEPIEPAAPFTTTRDQLIDLLARMTLGRCKGTFTRSTVVEGSQVPWTGDKVSPTLRAVVNHCIEQGAYKDPLGRSRTVGHFAQKLGDGRFLTSRRNSDFNAMGSVGMVEVVSSGDNSVVAHGFKPSVGGQSQRIIFRDHPETDCIVHAHVPLRPGAGTGEDGYGAIGLTPQWPHECGSHQCGQNTSDHLREVAPGIKAVMLEQHGFNVVFNRSVDPRQIIHYLDTTFDFSRHTGEALEDS